MVKKGRLKIGSDNGVFYLCIVPEILFEKPCLYFQTRTREFIFFRSIIFFSNQDDIFSNTFTFFSKPKENHIQGFQLVLTKWRPMQIP